jgi:WD40 repeat protein
VLRGHKDELDGASFNADGSLVLTSSEDGTARVWDAGDGSLLTTLRGNVGPVLAAAFAPDGERVATAGSDGVVRQWEAASGRTVYRGDGTWISGNRDGDAFVVLGPDGSVHVIDTATATESWVADAGAPQTWGGFSGDGSLLVTAGGDGIGHVWDAASGQPVSELRGHEETYLAADFYGTDQVLTWSDDGTARLWDPRSGEQLQVFDNQASIWEAHLSPDGTHVLTTGVADGVIRMWDAPTGEQLWKVTGLLGTGGIGAGFSADGKLVGTVSGPAIVWDVVSGNRVSTLDSTGKPLSVGFSPDNDTVLTRFDDGSARIWDPMTGDVIVTMAGHDGTVEGAGFSPDGRQVVTAGDDGLVRVWSAGTGQPIATYSSQGGAARWAFLAPDGPFVVSEGEGGVRIDRCDICVAGDELLPLAERRITRRLTADEQAAYLRAGREDSSVTKPRRPGLTDVRGESVPDGPLPAGTYSAVEFEPSFSFMVDEGWQATTFLDRTQFGEVPLAVVVQLQQIDVPSNGLSFIMLAPGRAIDGDKGWDERRNILPFPEDLGSWLSDHPNLRTGRSRPVVVDGISGTSVDTLVTSSPEDPWAVCPVCVTLLAFSLHHPLGPTTTDDLINALGPGEIDRWITLDTGEGRTLVNAFSASRKDFRAFIPIVNGVLESVEIGA